MPALAIDGFVASRSATWSELDELCSVVESGVSLDPATVLRLAALYREAVSDLALARRRFAGAPLVARLEGLVSTARDIVYDGPRRPTLRPLVRFATRGWWRLVAATVAWTAAGTAALVGATVVIAAWAASDPLPAARTLPVGLQRIPLGPHATLSVSIGLPRGVPQLDASWTAVAALALGIVALAGGLLAGIGTAVVVLAGALELGVPAGLAVSSGYAGRLGVLLADNGALLLLLVGILAGQGFRIGAAVLSRRTLAGSGRQAALILLGCLPLFGLAAGLQALTRSDAAIAAPVGLLAVMGIGAGLITLGGQARSTQIG